MWISFQAIASDSLMALLQNMQDAKHNPSILYSQSVANPLPPLRFELVVWEPALRRKSLDLTQQ